MFTTIPTILGGTTNYYSSITLRIFVQLRKLYIAIDNLVKVSLDIGLVLLAFKNITWSITAFSSQVSAVTYIYVRCGVPLMYLRLTKATCCLIRVISSVLWWSLRNLMTVLSASILVQQIWTVITIYDFCPVNTGCKSSYMIK